jgi:hypothetical protein
MLSDAYGFAYSSARTPADNEALFLARAAQLTAVSGHNKVPSTTPQASNTFIHLTKFSDSSFIPVLRQNFIGLKTVDYLTCSLHTPAHD